MISNYIKLAIRVLGRNKFFTAISLFGISFTIALLMILISMIESEVGKTPPLTDKDKMVIVPTLTEYRVFNDTIWSYDTTTYNGQPVIDSTFTLEESGRNNSNNPLAHWFLEKHLSDVPNASNYTFFNSMNTFNTYVNNSKVELRTLYTDHRFWEVFDFIFIEGNGFNEAAVENESQVGIITDYLADQYFGRTENVVGEMVEVDGKNFEVIGVVKPPGLLLLELDIVLPYTHDRDEMENPSDYGFGGYYAMYVGDKKSDVALIKEDIEFINSRTEVPAAAQDRFDVIEFTPFAFYEAYSTQILDMDDGEKSLNIMRWVIYSLIGFLIFLPALNLINLNIGRIMERSSEIGVRKAFGADRSAILFQFLIENIIQTFIGGVIGLSIALIGIYFINDTRLMGDIVLKLNYRFFFFAMIICLLFGLLSGLLPAYRMSKMHVVSALKSNKL